MKPIYDFEQQAPPVLHEALLRQKAHDRRRSRQVALAAAAGSLMQLVLLLLGWEALDWYPGLSLLCFGYVLVCCTGGGVLAIVYERKGRWQLE